MAGLTRYHYEKIADQLQQIAESMGDQLGPTSEDILQNIKNQNIRAGRKYAKSLGLTPKIDLDEHIRMIINDKIIHEIKRRKLKHMDIAISAKASRSKITCLMNRRRKGMTIDFMIRILSILGISLEISFN